MCDGLIAQWLHFFDPIKNGADTFNFIYKMAADMSDRNSCHFCLVKLWIGEIRKKYLQSGAFFWSKFNGLKSLQTVNSLLCSDLLLESAVFYSLASNENDVVQEYDRLQLRRWEKARQPSDWWRCWYNHVFNFLAREIIMDSSEKKNGCPIIGDRHQTSLSTFRMASVRHSVAFCLESRLSMLIVNTF